MTAVQINNIILFTFNMLFVLVVCGLFTGLTLIGLAIYELICQKLNGDKVYITPVMRISADIGINKMQLIRTKINGEVVEVEINKRFLKWGFKNRFNYWVMIKYILFKAKAGKGL